MPLAMARTLPAETTLDAIASPPAARRISLQNAVLLQNAFLIVALGMASVGCGAVTTQQGLGDAEKQIEEARKLEGEEFAPYEYTRATSYFQKAKKLTGEGMYEQAQEYAKLAQLSAEKAQDVARLGKERKGRLHKFAPKEPAAPRAPSAPSSGVTAPGAPAPSPALPAAKSGGK